MVSVLPATARADTNQTMIYEVYAGGIHAVQAKLDIHFTNDKRYDLVLGANTRGFLAKLAPWSGTFESHGWVVSADDFRPQLHKSTANWRDEIELKEYKYKKDRTFDGLWVTDHDKPTYKKKIDDALTQGTTDALTAALLAMQEVGGGGDCEQSSEVFDGSRRFEMKFNHENAEDLKASKYNIYEGPSVKCTVEVVPVAGKWHEKPRGWMSIQEQGRERGTMPTVWMGRLSKDGPAVPVKIMVKTAYGNLFMHLAEYRSGDEILIAEKRVLD
ncbi:MAG: DUF3108 domain-containing protein [Alphaproteobacteria bacterium]|nr:DUF3108 domain-containing protein [Alphaproteobacteria bacterium]